MTVYRDVAMTARAGSPRVSIAAVVDRNWRRKIREWLQDVSLIIKVIGGAIGIGLGIREFLSKLKPLGARPRAAACPSTQEEIQQCRI